MTRGYNSGGQNRSIQCPCGWGCSGSIRDANFKHKLHAKVCDTAKQMDFSSKGFDAGVIQKMAGVSGKSYFNGEYSGKQVSGNSFSDMNRETVTRLEKVLLN